MKKTLFVLLILLMSAGYVQAQEPQPAPDKSQAITEALNLVGGYQAKAVTLLSNSATGKAFRIYAPEVNDDSLAEIRGGALGTPAANIQLPIRCDIILWDENKPKTAFITDSVHGQNVTTITWSGR